MELAAKLDDYGKPAWIAVMVLGFIVFWPIGLGSLAYLLGSGRMGCWGRNGPGRWYGEHRGRHRNGAKGWFGGSGRQEASSGNHAFDEYREETLRRLEDEQKAFLDFLERLRQAKDKAEFDQFMAEHRNGPSSDPSSDRGPDQPPPGRGPSGPEGFAAQQPG